MANALMASSIHALQQLAYFSILANSDRNLCLLYSNYSNLLTFNITYALGIKTNLPVYIFFLFKYIHRAFTIYPRLDVYLLVDFLLSSNCIVIIYYGKRE